MALGIGSQDAVDEDRELLLFDPREYECPAPSVECLDCGVDTHAVDEWYMVRDDVWVAANPSQSGILCIGCLEDRLGRRLTRSDFTPCLGNKDWPKSARLASRMLSQNARLHAQRPQVQRAPPDRPPHEADEPADVERIVSRRESP
jgi:hypothetical protein